MYQIQIKGVRVKNLNASTVRYPEALIVIDEDYYNTDGNGAILILEREDHLFCEAAKPDGPFVGLDAEPSKMPGTDWLDSPNDVIEAWYGTFHDQGQLIRPNIRPAL